LVIDKALQEENPEKKSNFANSIAYYMKLAYNTWHKELVHDDAIRSELNTITNGQLEFTNTPFVKAFRDREGRDNNRFGRGGKNFQQRNNSGGGRNDRNNKGGSGGKHFKKRFK
jgi:hypothetical protein